MGASAAFSAAALLLCMCAGAAQGYSLMGFTSSMQLASKGSLFSSNIGASPMLRLAPSLGLRARQQRASTAIKAQLYADEEKPKAMKELMQVRFAKADPNELATWIQNWPKGGVKDAYGLPKLMLPVSSEKKGAGLKIIFKGSLDPWLQIELEGDTVRVYRCTALATTSLQVSALKEREEGKICDKLKLDLTATSFGDMKDVNIPSAQPKKEEPVVDDSVEDDAVAAVPTAAESKSDSDGPEPTPV